MRSSAPLASLPFRAPAVAPPLGRPASTTAPQRDTAALERRARTCLRPLTVAVHATHMRPLAPAATVVNAAPVERPIVTVRAEPTDQRLIARSGVRARRIRDVGASAGPHRHRRARGHAGAQARRVGHRRRGPEQRAVRAEVLRVDTARGRRCGEPGDDRAAVRGGDAGTGAERPERRLRCRSPRCSDPDRGGSTRPSRPPTPRAACRRPAPPALTASSGQPRPCGTIEPSCSPQFSPPSTDTAVLISVLISSGCVVCTPPKMTRRPSGPAVSAGSPISIQSSVTDRGAPSVPSLPTTRCVRWLRNVLVWERQTTCSPSGVRRSATSPVVVVGVTGVMRCQSARAAGAAASASPAAVRTAMRARRDIRRAIVTARTLP